MQVTNGGESIVLTNNTWRRTLQTYTISPNTVIEFEFSSSAEGEIHGIGFDTDARLSPRWTFKLYGTQSYGIREFNNYGGGVWSYRIPVGQYFTGSGMHLLLINDQDSGSGANSTFSRIRIFDE